MPEEASESRIAAGGCSRSLTSMFRFGGDTLKTHQSQLIVTAIAASLVTGTLFSTYTAYITRSRRRKLNDDVARSVESSTIDIRDTSIELVSPHKKAYDDILSIPGASLEDDEEFMKEQLARYTSAKKGFAQIPHEI